MFFNFHRRSHKTYFNP